MTSPKTDLHESVLDDLSRDEAPTGLDRRSSLMRVARMSAMAVLTGRTLTHEARAAAASAPQAKPITGMSPTLDVVKRSKGPVMTTIEEFYKVGPGPSSSHTI